MNKTFNYAIIGKNWGSKINKILRGLNKNSIIVDLDYKNLKFNNYLNELKKIIFNNKISVVWLAIPADKQYLLCKFLIDCKVHLILEKPMIFNKYQKNIINKSLKKNNLHLSVNFQYIFLYELLNFDHKLNFDNIEYIFNHSNPKKNLSPEIDLGIHMVAIKKIYFNRINNYKLKTSFNNINQRYIIFKLKDKLIFRIDFTNSKQRIIQSMIKYFENKVITNLENKVDLNFSFSVYQELLKKIN